ncbi:MAG: hypothetical protein P8X77_18390 [Maritimibacter sp.]
MAPTTEKTEALSAKATKTERLLALRQEELARGQEENQRRTKTGAGG